MNRLATGACVALASLGASVAAPVSAWTGGEPVVAEEWADAELDDDSGRGNRSLSLVRGNRSLSLVRGNRSLLVVRGNRSLSLVSGRRLMFSRTGELDGRAVEHTIVLTVTNLTTIIDEVTAPSSDDVESTGSAADEAALVSMAVDEAELVAMAADEGRNLPSGGEVLEPVEPVDLSWAEIAMARPAAVRFDRRAQRVAPEVYGASPRAARDHQRDRRDVAHHEHDEKSAVQQK